MMLCAMRALCECYTRIEVDVEMDSGVFKIDPIESAYVHCVCADVCVESMFIWPHVQGSSGECVITFRAWTARGRREMDAERQSFHF